MNITLVIGGARSGKSSFAENYVDGISKNVGYIATAQPFDEGMKDRIKKHVNQRPDHWPTFECYGLLSPEIQKISQVCDVVLLDCITVLVTNLMFLHEDDWTAIPRETINRIEGAIIEEIDALIGTLRIHGLSAVIVTNEVGAGIVPENRLARVFRDIAGRVNQRIAKEADAVYFLVSGIPMKIK